jgi:hypothetical protein
MSTQNACDFFKKHFLSSINHILNLWEDSEEDPQITDFTTNKNWK